MGDGHGHGLSPLPCDKGPAVLEIYEEDGELWVAADDPYYSSRVNYCPVCGYEAEKKVEIEDDRNGHSYTMPAHWQMLVGMAVFILGDVALSLLFGSPRQPVLMPMLGALFGLSIYLNGVTIRRENDG